jgi:hypothetical protein
VTPHVATQIEKEKAADISVVADISVANVGLADLRAVNASVGEDKTKTLRRKQSAAQVSHHAQNLRHNLPKNHQYATSVAIP